MILIPIVMSIVTVLLGAACPRSEGFGPELLLSLLFAFWMIYAMFNLKEVRRSVTPERKAEGISKFCLSACLIILCGPFLFVGNAKGCYAIVKDVDGRNIRVEHGGFLKWPFQEFVKQELDPRGGLVSLRTSSFSSPSLEASYLVTADISFEWENRWLADGAFSVDAFQCVVDDAMRETTVKYTREQFMTPEGLNQFRRYFQAVVADILRSRNLELKKFEVDKAFVQIQVI